MKSAVDWLKEEFEKYGSSSSLLLDWNKFDELCEQAKEMEIQQQGYSDEQVEKLIKTTYEETMRAMVEWFMNNMDKSSQNAESAIDNYVYPRLKNKGIKFKKK